MTVTSTMNGRTILFIPVADEPVENGYWIYQDTLQRIDGK